MAAVLEAEAAETLLAGAPSGGTHWDRTALGFMSRWATASLLDGPHMRLDLTAIRSEHQRLSGADASRPARAGGPRGVQGGEQAEKLGE